MNSHCKPETTTPSQSSFIGVDVSKHHLDSFHPSLASKRFPNDAQGIRDLVAHIRSLHAPHVVCEATGGYESSLVYDLMAMDVSVSVVQPSRVRYFARAEGLLAKTDKIDAKLLARFGQKMEPRPSVPADPATIQLRQICETRSFLVDKISELDNRLGLAQGVLKEELASIREDFLTRLEQVEDQRAEFIKRHHEMLSRNERLQQVRGVGPVLASTLLAYVPELGKITDKQLSAIIGVAPHPQESGKQQGRRSIRGGRAGVRKVLYMAAIAATRFNPILREVYRRLCSKGKAKKVAIVAVMRKLLGVLNKLIADPTFCLA